jgi:V/A-type H+-transporting ATPase subunit D
MALLHVNPTRMALMDLKRSSTSALRGHKLLKDKQDGLMQQFLAIIRSAKEMRRTVEAELSDAFMSFLMASAWLSDAEIENALSSPQAIIELSVETRSVMGVKIPSFRLRKEGAIRTYGYAHTNTLLDQAIDSFDRVFEMLIRLAEIEKQAENMAIELETTRRRVNGLEHKIIPDLKQTVKYIKMRLDESERAAIIGTMRVKAGMEKSA